MRVLLLASCLCAATSQVRAQDRDASSIVESEAETRAESEDELRSRLAFERGRAAMGAGQPAEAADAFAEAFALLPRLSTAFNLALASHAAGRWEDAAHMLEQIDGGSLGELERDQTAAVARLRRDVASHLGRVVVQLRGSPAAGAWLRVDGGTPIEASERNLLYVRPGAHMVEASGPGVLTASAEVRVSAGGERALALSFVRATGTLTVEYADAERTISIDGLESGRGRVELELAPGTYHASVDGCAECDTEIDIRAGSETHVVLGRGAADEGVMIALVVLASVAALAGAVTGIAFAVAASEQGIAPPQSDPVFGVVVALSLP